MPVTLSLLAAAPAPPDVRSLVLVLAASTLGAILSRIHHRVVLPTVVVEIVLGILIGPQVLGWASVDSYIAFLENFGLVFLFFFAGIEVVEKHVPRQRARTRDARLGRLARARLRRRLRAARRRPDAEGWLIGVALATTALGTLVPILADAGLLPTPLGRAVLGTGVAGEFWPIVVISVFLTGVYGARTEAILLVVFGVVVAGAAVMVTRARPTAVLRVLRDTIHTTGQAAVRLSVLALASLVLLANDVGFDFVLGALAAGLIVGLVLDTPSGEVVRMRLEGIGFGFLIPIYFVVTGMTFDLDSFLTVNGLLLAAMFLGLLLVTRGVSAFLWLRELGRRPTASARPVRRDGPAADRCDRRHRHGPRRDRRRTSAPR